MAKIETWLADGWSATSNNRGQVNHYAGTCALGVCASADDALVFNTANVHVADAHTPRAQVPA